MPLILALEAVRQLGLSVAHVGFEVPYDNAFIMDDAWIRWSAGTSPQLEPWSSLDLVVAVAIVDHGVRNGRTTSLALDMVLKLPTGEQVASGGGVFRCLTPSQYRAVRRRALSAAGLADAEYRRDLLWGMAEHRVEPCLVGMNVRDPFIFDHLTDHVPGLAFVDASNRFYEQVFPDRELIDLSLQFTSFAEFSPGIEATIVESGADSLTITFTQRDVVVAECICNPAGARVSLAAEQYELAT
ncbi:ScbA/BarX family gamma-butyrolactone biosynthesis protein [Klugiella xanthotipulae]